jgi:outer membrane protein assembly factor BamB
MMTRVSRWVGFRFHRRALPVIAAVGLLASLTVALGPAGPADAQTTANWPQFQLNNNHSSYSTAATSITPSNVTDLQPAWRWTVPASTNGASTGIYGTPVSEDGIMYVGSFDGEFYAVNEATQQVLWSQNLGTVPGIECADFTAGITSTAALATDPTTGDLAVYVNAPDGDLYALDAATGDILWQSVVGVPSPTVNNYFAWGSPMVANGNVYVGISSYCDTPLVPAGVLGFNAGSGASIGEWHSLTPDTNVGASVWSTPVAGPGGSVIVTTGNGPASGTSPEWDDSIVKLNGSNMDFQTGWEIPKSQQILDGDFGAGATVFTADLDGTTTKMVGACNKNGIFYALKEDDLSAGPVWQDTINVPYSGAGGLCVSNAIWNGTDVIQGAGEQTTIGTTTYQGGMYALNPATGAVVWATGLPGEIVGSPTEDGKGVVAAPVWESTTGNYGVYLLSASTGAILNYIPLGENRIFGQPVFAGDYLLVGGLNPFVGITAYQVSTPGKPITAVSPSKIGQGATKTITLTGSGFSGTPSVWVSSTDVTVDSVTVVSSTELSVQVTAESGAPQGVRDISVIEPGPVADTCTNCLTVDRAPTLTSASPDSIAQGGSAALTLTGTNFQSGATVTSSAGITFSGTKFVKATELTSTATVAASVATGTYNLQVTNPDGGTATCTGCLTVTAAPPAPTLTGVSPGAVGQQAKVTLDLTGTNFTSGSTVSFSASGITADAVDFVSSTSLEVTTSVTSSATIGAANVTVTTAGGSATCTGCLTVDAHPSISKLSPDSIAAGDTATLTVTGAHFVSGLTVNTSISGATVGTPTDVTSTSLSVTVTVPSGTASGTYLLRVVNPDGGTATTDLAVT